MMAVSVRGVDGGGGRRADDGDEPGADRGAHRARPRRAAPVSRPGPRPRRHGRGCTCVRRAAARDRLPARARAGWRTCAGRSIPARHRGCRCRRAARSPHSARPGSSRWPGLSRKNVTVRVACTTGPPAVPVVPSRPLGTSTATTGLPDGIDGRHHVGRHALERARQAGAEQGIDDEVGAGDRQRQRAARSCRPSARAISAASPLRSPRTAEQAQPHLDSRARAAAAPPRNRRRRCCPARRRPRWPHRAARQARRRPRPRPDRRSPSARAPARRPRWPAVIGAAHLGGREQLVARAKPPRRKPC